MSAPQSSEIGVPLDALRNLGLSSTVRGLLDYAMDLKARHDARGPLDTGAMFFALIDRGRDSSREWYGPAVFNRMISREGEPLLGKIRETYFHEASQVPGDGSPIATRELNAVFEIAANLPRHDGILAARHLIVALLASPPEDGRERRVPHFHDLIHGLRLDPEKLAREFVESLAVRGEEQEREAWLKILGPTPEGGSIDEDPGLQAIAENTKTETDIGGADWAGSKASGSAHETVGPRGPRFSGYQADTPSGRAADDCLNLDATVSAFANLLASPQLSGNLSLGVFGNWGSGKSFFMERLLTAVDELTKSARDAEAHAAESNTGDVPSGPPVYWSNIAQIRFNAWHYADANLWASLMSHLLAELQRWDPNPPRGGTLSPLQNALGQLEISAAAQAEAKKRQETASAAVKSAEQAREKTQQKCADAAQAVAAAAQRSVWSFIREQLLPEKKVLADQFARAGLAAEDAAQPIEKVYAELKELSTAGGQVRAVVSSLLRSPEGNRRLLEFAAWIGVPVAVLLLLLFTPLHDWLRESAAWFATTLAGVSVALARVAGWVKTHAASVLDALRPLAVVRRTIEEGLVDAEARKAAEVASKENELAQARAELAAANVEVSERTRELEKATEAVAEAVSGRAVSRFIERRLASGDYQKHLGLVALIRRDFEQLSELIRAHNAQRRSLAEERKSAVDALLKARPALTPAELEAIFANLGVNRIILYIDDLDRCPAERVVQVLEAIHLLLAFPIFVVVVGVDARWMHHALATQFPALLGRRKSTSDNGRNGAEEPETGLRDVTPSDYLEKIFQIPFWVPPLDGAGAKAMLTHLTRDLRDATPSGATLDRGVYFENAAAGSGERSKAGAGTAAGSARSGGAKSGADGSAASDRSDRSEKSDSSDKSDSSAAAKLAMQAGSAGEKPTVLRRPEALRLSDVELSDMQTLAPIIGRSPRATKRFVNSYRLLKASLTPKESAQLASNQGRSARVPMFLLAVVTGLPELAPRLFAQMAWERGGENPFAALKRLAGDGGVEIETLRRLEEFEFDPDAAAWRAITQQQLMPWTGRIAQFAFDDLLPTVPARTSAAPLPPKE